MTTLRQLLGLTALLLVGMILGTAVYESVVLVPNFRSNIPDSLEHFRLFMQWATPGTFFRVVAPAAQVSLLICVAVFWKARPARYWFIGALVALVASDVITFNFHYPRNHLLFGAPLTHSVPQLEQAAREWAMGNLVRIALVLVSGLAAGCALRPTDSRTWGPSPRS